jgi:hypothetical protein
MTIIFGYFLITFCFIITAACLVVTGVTFARKEGRKEERRAKQQQQEEGK